MKKYFTIKNFFAVALLFVIGQNTYYHASSPAYKYYKQQGESLRIAFDDYKAKISKEFLPALYFVATNSSSYAKNEVHVFANSQANQSLGVVDALYFTIDCKPGLKFANRLFFVGDDFFGYPILGITPTILTTAQGFFYLVDPPYYKKEEKK